MSSTQDSVNYSVNYAGYDDVCLAKATTYTDASAKALFTARFKPNTPTNLCNLASSKYTPIPIGNVGIAAGGFNPSTPGVYSGGNINLGNKSIIYGRVLAGNILKTNGDTRVFGYVSAAAQQGTGVTNNVLTGSTTIDLTLSNDNYQAADNLPSASSSSSTSSSSGSSGSSGGSSAVESKLLWAKYL